MTADRLERRASVRVFVIDGDLNLEGNSGHEVSVPPGLRRTLQRLIAECQADPNASHAMAFAEARIVRVVPLSGIPDRYAASIERHTLSLERLLKSLDQYGLSGRERDVLLLALDGKTAAETAKHLNIAPSTATDYLNRLQTKVGARNKSEMIAKILGWIPASGQPKT